MNFQITDKERPPSPTDLIAIFGSDEHVQEIILRNIKDCTRRRGAIAQMINEKQKRFEQYDEMTNFYLTEWFINNELKGMSTDTEKKLELLLNIWREIHGIEQKKSGKYFDYEGIREKVLKYPIEQFIGRYTKLRKVGNRMYGRCPLHDDRSPSLHVYLNTNSFNCFGCNKGGDIISFYRYLTGCTFREALEELSNL